ncbi:hypothetical protein COCON_G00097900 [Conger conger]|uniref:Uncharacterized protein n=1 Tax=Conger conger TaxID=82655 RepID=A0A9Q1I1K4_CONCO|nr:hypothetical protein COCON_G00097900 [Conger conger]
MNEVIDWLQKRPEEIFIPSGKRMAYPIIGATILRNKVKQCGGIVTEMSNLYYMSEMGADVSRNLRVGEWNPRRCSHKAQRSRSLAKPTIQVPGTRNRAGCFPQAQG